MKAPYRWLIGVPVVMLISGLLVLLNIFPYHPKTATGWIVLFIVAPPLIISLEELGGLLLDRKFLKHWPSPLRILYGVIVLSITCTVIIGALFLLKPLLERW